MITRGVSATLVALAAILGVVVLECVALSRGVNGTMYGLSLGAILGVAGGFVGFKARDIWRG